MKSDSRPLSRRYATATSAPLIRITCWMSSRSVCIRVRAPRMPASSRTGTEEGRAHEEDRGNPETKADWPCDHGTILPEPPRGGAAARMTDPRFAQAQALAAEGRAAEAVGVCAALVADRPDDAAAWVLLGAARLRAGDVEGSMAASRRAIALDPRLPLAHCNLGAAHAERLEMAAAVRCYQEALALDPDHALTHVNRALAWLQQGTTRAGSPRYQWRSSTVTCFAGRCRTPNGAGAASRSTAAPCWCTGSRAAATFSRWRASSQLRARGVRVVLRCTEPLARLLRSSRLTDDLSIEGTPLPPFDRYISVMGLPGLIGTDVDTVPAPVPYVAPDPRLTERWARWLRDEPRPRVGLCWQGNPHHARDRERSIPPACLAPLADVAGVRLVSLQKGHGRAADLPLACLDLAPRLHDFADTAAAIGHVDLVVTVDTSVAHLAGALGRPVWVLLPFAPDWRWLLAREDSPCVPDRAPLPPARARRLGERRLEGGHGAGSDGIGSRAAVDSIHACTSPGVRSRCS